MTQNKLQKLLDQANKSVEQQDWQKAIDILQEALCIEQENTGILSIIGTCYLNLGNASEAISYFEKVTTKEIDSPDVFNNLGVAYLLNHDFENAEIALKQALWIDEDNVQSWKNLAQVYLSQKERLVDGLQILASIVKANPEDTEALFQLALSYEIGGDIVSAKDILRRILEIDPNHQQAKNTLEDIEKNSRDEQVRKLSGLKSLLQKETTEQPKPGTSMPDRIGLSVIEKKAIFLTPDEYTMFERLPAIIQAYQLMNYKVVAESKFSQEFINQYDLVIINNPLLAPWLIDAANQCIQKKKLFALDLDVDFQRIMPDHPAYSMVGPGNQRAMQVLSILLKEAFMVTVASRTLQDRLQAEVKKAVLAQPTWDPSISAWKRPGPKHAQLQVGWMGSVADFADLKTIYEPLKKFFDEYPDSVWVAAGCDEAYDLFDNIPEERRLFLPPPTPDSIAYLISNFDVILLPVQNNSYNQAKSDVSVLYSGIRRVPWIASRYRAVEEWKEGGYIAETKEDWYQYLKALADDKELRRKLGDAGRAKSEERQLH